MSRFEFDDYDEYSPNQADLWHANVERALTGKRGKKALGEVREALLALPEKRLISGALCTVRIDRKIKDASKWTRQDAVEKVAQEGEGVCAIGAFLWHKRVKAGVDPQVAFDELPLLLDTDNGGLETAEAGKAAGMTFTLAWTLASRNDSMYEEKTPEERYESFLGWLDEQLAVPA